MKKRLLNGDVIRDITPEDIEELFAGLNADEQALFYNHLAKVASDWLHMQAQYITDSSELSLAGRRVMQTIGDYSHWGLVPSRTRENWPMTATIHCPSCGKEFKWPTGMGSHKKTCDVTWEQLFGTKVKKGDGCWEWQNGLISSGYGCAYIGRKKYVASRLSWIYTYGDIPKGAHVLHKCDNPRCVRPDHLYLGNAEDEEASNRCACCGKPLC